MCEPRGWGGGENVLKTKLGLLMRRVGGVRGEIIQTNLCYRMHEDGNIPPSVSHNINSRKK